jgi:hypoxanthine-guanine phosphoribosyltransferase
MKKLLLITLTSCIFAAQTIPSFADATEAEKEQIELARKAVSKAVEVDEGRVILIEEIMKNGKAKKLVCEMLAKDPEAVKLIVAK